MDEDQTRSYSFKDISGLLTQVDDPSLELEEAESEDVVDGDLVRELSTLSNVPWIGDHQEHREETATPIMGLVPSAPKRLAAEQAEPAPGDHEFAPPWFQLAQTLRQEAEQSQGQRAAVLYYDLGRIHETHLGEPDEALKYYRESYEHDPKLGANIQSLIRLLTLMGQHKEVCAALEQELATASTVADQSAILTDSARVKLEALSDTAGAREDLLEALELDSDNRVASVLLEHLYLATGDTASLQTHWERNLESWGDPALRSALMCELARLRERELADTSAATDLYRSAVDLCSENSIAQRALLRVARLTSDHVEAAKLYERLADEGQASEASSALLEAARLYAGPLGDFPQAIQCLERACDLSPDDPLPLCELSLILEQAGHWDRLSDTLEKASACTDDASEAAELYSWLARVRLHQQDDPDGALEALQQAVALSPDHTPARRMLGQLYLQRERYEDLILLLAKEVDLFADNRRRAATYYRMGDILEHKLQDPHRAEEAYRRALMVTPGYRPAIHGLSRVILSLGRYHDLLSIYQRIVDSIEDHGEKIRILHQIAEIWESKLEDQTSAIAGYERLLSIEPDNLPALRALRRIYASSARWQDLVDVLRAEIARNEDPRRIVALLSEITDIQQHKLVDHRAALATSLDALDRDPSFLPALASASRLLDQLGDHEQLLRLYRNQLDHCAHVEQRAWLLMKIGRLFEERLESRSQAAAIYVEAMTQSIAPQVMADQLIRLHPSPKNPDELLTLVMKLPLPQSSRAQALHHRRIAEISLGNQPLALSEERLRRSLAASFNDASLYLLMRLYTSREERRRLIDLCQLEAQQAVDSLARTSALLKQARLWSAAVHDQERAVDTLLELTEEDPDNGVLIRQLCWMLSRLAQWDTLLSTLKRCHDLFDQPEHRLACLVEMAAICQERLDDLPAAAAASLKLAEGEQFSSEVLSILEAYYRAERDPVGLAHILGQYYKSAQFSPERAALLTAIASLQMNEGEIQQGTDLFQAAMELRPHYLPAARGLCRAARSSGDHCQQARALQIESEASQNRAHRTRCLLDAGQAWLSAGRREAEAIGAYQRVLEIEGDHLEATEALLSLYGKTQRHEEIMDLLDRVLESAKDSMPHRYLLVRGAARLRNQYNNMPAARQALEHALALDPDNREILSSLADLYREAGDWQALSTVNQRLVPLTKDPAQLRELHRELGQIGDEKLPDADVAIDQYKHVVDLDPNDIESLRRLGQLLVREKDWLAAVGVIEILTTKEQQRSRLKEHFVLLAEIYSEGLNDLPAAMNACRRALALDPGDLSIADKMISLLPKREDKQALDAHLQSSMSVHGARLDRNPFHIESYVALRDRFDRQDLWDKSYVVRCLLITIGGGTEEDRGFVKKWSATAPSYPQKVLSEKLLASVMHPDEVSLRHLLLACEAILRVNLDLPERREIKGRRFTERSHPELTAMLEALEGSMGGLDYRRLMVSGGVEQLAVENTVPPTLYVGRQMEELSTGELRFRLACLLAHIRLNHAFFAHLGPGKLGEVVAAIIAATLPSCDSYVTSPFIENLGVVLRESLTPEIIETLIPPCQHLSSSRLDPMRWIEVMAHSEDRLALLATGDVSSAIMALSRDEGQCDPNTLKTVADFKRIAGHRLQHLLSFAVSDDHLSLRRQLGLAVDGD